VIYTGKTSIHIAVDVYSRDFENEGFEKKTHCVIVFVSVDGKGKPVPVKKWEPRTEKEVKLAAYAKKLKELREQIGEEMEPFFKE
jgi:acyl-CoA hydrolase